MKSSTPDNWLHAERFNCPQCHELLFRVDHSPFYDSYFLYCERCANRAEVGFYDSVYETIFSHIITEQEGTALALMRAIEQRLKPCSCGGRFRYDAPRRCHRCFSEVIANAPGVDLWPGYYDVDVDERNPTDEEIALVEEFETNHLHQSDVWQMP